MAGLWVKVFLNIIIILTLKIIKWFLLSFGLFGGFKNLELIPKYIKHSISLVKRLTQSQAKIRNVSCLLNLQGGHQIRCLQRKFCKASSFFGKSSPAASTSDTSRTLSRLYITKDKQIIQRVTF